VAAIKKITALAALTQAALALPGTAAADVSTDYLYSDYREGDISASRSASGRAAERYEIQSHLFRVVAPLGEQTLGLDLSYETMSGASPWFVTPGADGKPVQVMSGASIREERIDAQGTWALPLLGQRIALSAGYSDEEDYRAINGGAELQIDSGEALSWSAGVGYSDDRLEPTVGASSPDVIDHATRSTLTLYGGASLILGESTIVQTSLSFGNNDGYLTDPYKRVYVESQSNTIAESRPDGRQSWALSTKLRHNLASLGGALHVDYRYYQDDWKIRAHTLEIAWHQALGDTWRIAPALRWYSQSQAFFYEPYFEDFRDDGFASSDYRMSPFGALSARLDLTKTLFEHWAIGAGVEYYQASGDYALKSVDVENPGLVEYLSLRARLSYRF